MSTILDNSIGKRPEESSVLVVGAGGIGCELLKSLALCRFQSIGVIDLDTIEVSNLNRQFLFRREHVNQSKATVACNTIRHLCPSIHIEPFHGDVITDPRFDISFYKQYDLVINALDNIQARQHVNRMCLLCSKPLIDSGSTGYNGQATLIFKDHTQCYDCIIKPKQQRTYAVCTIRSTPSQPIHCIVWAKFLYNQFFGDEDDINNEEIISNENNHISIRDWIHSEIEEFEPRKIFNKLFFDDINYLLTMKNLWEKRRQPIAIEYEKACQINEDNQIDFEQSTTIPKINDQRIEIVSEYVQMFIDSLIKLKQRFDKQRQLAKINSEPSFLIWDKNDDIDLQFVTSSANLRAYIFGINLTSKFDVKSMAGNIIPAVATTNAIVAGITVLQARKILATLPNLSLNQKLTSIKQLTNVFISTDRKTGAIIQPIALEEPNPECYQCKNIEEIVPIKMNISLITLRSLYQQLIRNHFKMNKPDIYIDDGSNRILISAEDDEDDEKMSKTLDQFKLIHGTILCCDEEFDNINEFSNVISTQQMKIKLMLQHTDEIRNKDEYIIINDQIIQEIKKTSKRKLSSSSSSSSEDENDDIEHLDNYQNELNIIKKTKRLSTIPREYDDTISIKINEFSQNTSENDLKNHKLNNNDDETNTIAQNSNMINEDCYCIDISDL